MTIYNRILSAIDRIGKHKFIMIGVFGIWFILIVGMFMMHSITDDPFFGSTKNYIYRHQNRGDILDRKGSTLVHGQGRKRRYRLGPAGSPIIGFVNPDIGSEGFIEQKYAEHLIANKKSKLWYLLFQSKKGYALRTTLDKDLILTAYEAMGNHKGALVVMTPKGEILVSLSLPSYDPNRMTKKYYSKLIQSPEKPLFNRAFDGSYSPGSIWKTVIAIKLLEKGSHGQPVICNGSLRVGNREIRCMGKHGLIKNMDDAMKVSCNVWWMKNALSELTAEDIKEASERFMDKEIHKDFSKEDVAFAAIGQGQIMVSPLKLAILAIAIGNRGIQPTAQVVKTKVDTIRVMNEKIAQRVLDMMSLVVRQGTARGLSNNSYWTAAKTGTAEQDTPRGKINNALLFGVAGRSKDNPELAFAMVIENAEDTGGKVCVPIMKKVLDSYFRREKQ